MLRLFLFFKKKNCIFTQILNINNYVYKKRFAGRTWI